MGKSGCKCGFFANLYLKMGKQPQNKLKDLYEIFIPSYCPKCGKKVN